MKHTSVKLVLLPSTNIQIRDVAQLPSLSVMLRKGSLGSERCAGDVDCQLQSLGISFESDEVAVGAIERYACGETPVLGNWCIKADPVNLVPNRDNPI